MAYTGGKLNELNGKYGISAPHRSVPVMKLIRHHRPKSREELCGLIRQHHQGGPCPCGVVSQGSVEDFGKKLYEAQFREWGEARYTLQECVQWEYDLFVVQSLKGTHLELAALRYFQQNLACVGLSFSMADGFLDEELRVDILVGREEQAICGIQVKPLSFHKMRQGVVAFNHRSNAKWGKPVCYLFYDENGQFTNAEAVVAELLALI